ncbi:MAG: hypothetical protein FGM36_16025 [Burkholderiaceae bacterium]|nr:hypothetical protein [Burkholderiaceae bacterium]
MAPQLHGNTQLLRAQGFVKTSRERAGGVFAAKGSRHQVRLIAAALVPGTMPLRRGGAEL